MESEGDRREIGPNPGESQDEREEVEAGHRREDSDGKETDSEDKGEYGQRVVTSHRNGAIETGSDRFEGNSYADNDDEEVDQAGSVRRPPNEEDQDNFDHSTPDICDVFGDSEEEKEEEPAYDDRNNKEQFSDRSPVEEGSYGNGLRPEDMLADEDGHYQSEL